MCSQMARNTNPSNNSTSNKDGSGCSSSSGNVALSCDGDGGNSVNQHVEMEPRYPKREGTRQVNYKELEAPDDDHFLLCDKCNLFYEGDCPIHTNIRPFADSATPATVHN